MSYVCVYCHTFFPCAKDEHNWAHSSKVWMPRDAEVSIPCWVLDHSECELPMLCTCRCHDQRLDEPSSITPLPQSLAEQ